MRHSISQVSGTMPDISLYGLSDITALPFYDRHDESDLCSGCLLINGLIPSDRIIISSKLKVTHAIIESGIGNQQQDILNLEG